MTRVLSLLPGLLVVAVVVGIPTTYAWYRENHFRNFRVVSPGVLYRSGQLSLPALRAVLRDCRIKTVVTLRDASRPGEPPPDLEEERFCEAQEINYCRITPRKWGAADGSVPAAEGVARFQAVMDNKDNYPVLVHCYAGIHRSGAYSAVYRMEYENWSNREAIAEMRAQGYRDLEDEWDLLSYLEHYQPRQRKVASSQ